MFRDRKCLQSQPQSVGLRDCRSSWEKTRVCCFVQNEKINLFDCWKNLGCLYSNEQRRCLLILCSKILFLVSEEEFVWIRWLVRSVWENDASFLVRRLFILLIWIFLQREIIISGFLYPKLRTIWWQLYFSCNLYWLELTGDEFEKCHKFCDENIMYVCFVQKTFRDLFVDWIVCSNTEYAFWQTKIVCNFKLFLKIIWFEV